MANEKLGVATEPSPESLWGATQIVGKKGRREIGKCFPSKFSSLHLESTLNVGK